jgi:carboxymethylenebutenolidase
METDMNDLTELAGLRNYPLARRGVIMTGLISGFTVAAQRVEAQAIHTDTEGLQAGEVQIPTCEGSLPAYFARPAKRGPFPIVLVNEEIFGVHEYIKDVCRRFAKLGYLAVATEYYARVGDLSKMTDISRIIADVISKAPDAQYMADADATVAWAEKNEGDSARIGAIGFCRGGRQTWLYAAHSPHLKAAVAYYGPLGGTPSPIQPQTALDLAAQIQCPLLGLYAGKDTGIPVDVVRQAEAKAKAEHKIVEIVVYPEAAHGFHADYRPSYRQADAEEAWKRTLEWFRRFGVTPSG